MRLGIRIFLSGLGCVAIAAVAVSWLVGAGSLPAGHRATATPRGKATPSSGGAGSSSGAGAVRAGAAGPATRATFPDPNAPGTSSRVYLDRAEIDQGIYRAVLNFAPTRADISLEELSASLKSRASEALAFLTAEHDRLALDVPPTAEQAFRVIQIRRLIAFVHMYDGRFGDATSWLQRAMELCRTPSVPDEVRANLRALLGVVALRRGEVENCIACLGPSSCILPIVPEAVHSSEQGSRDAAAQLHRLFEGVAW